MAPNYYHNHATKSYPFMTCIIRVDTRSNWQRTVRKVLEKCNGVGSFRMDDNGVVEISGTVDPSLLLKMLGKAGRSAELSWLQFGECSSNLFMQTSNPGGGSYYAGDGRHLHVGNTARPKLPQYSKAAAAAAAPQNYGYYDHEYNYSYGNDRDYYSHGYPQSAYYEQQALGLGLGLGLGYDHQYEYDHYQSAGFGYSSDAGGNQIQIQNPSALPYRGGHHEDIGCCTVM